MMTEHGFVDRQRYMVTSRNRTSAGLLDRAVDLGVSIERLPMLGDHHHVAELCQIVTSDGRRSHIIISRVSLLTKDHTVMLCDMDDLVLQLEVWMLPFFMLR